VCFLFRPYHAIGIDFDGTLTSGGPPTPEVLEAIADARKSGLRSVLVTGRILAELYTVFPDPEPWFDAIVAENGAVVASGGRMRLLASALPLALDEALLHRDVRFRRGQVLLASTREYAPILLEEIERLGVDCKIVQNRGELMVLPSAVTKATGFVSALHDLALSPHNAVGIGDAENDQSLLAACELGVAVANAVPSLRAAADLVLPEPAEQGVLALLRGPLLRGEQRLALSRFRVPLGRTREGAPVDVPASGVNLLFRGPTLSGKSFAVGVWIEGLIELGYSVCVIDPEGDHVGLGSMHGCIVRGGHEALPSVQRLASFFQATLGSLVVDLSQLPAQERARASAEILELLQEQRDRTGLPHWIVLEEAHVPLAEGGAGCPTFRPEQKGFGLVTYQPDRLCPAAQEAADFVISMEAPGLASISAAYGPVSERDFALGPRATQHVRHQHKYAHAELPREKHFYLRTPACATGRSAGNLEQLHRELHEASAEVLQHHTRNRDFSRWAAEVLRDSALAE
jgi:hydroxymethylpyrimidine pyrophosphatase-like HAD family hydrolase